jgi:outer membrane protein assembly factor BamB
VPPASEIRRLCHPFGGIACVGKTGLIEKTVRGPLEGAGNWTHQYADPGNTCCSEDTAIRAPLNLLWFRDCDFPMPQRHVRGPSPLVKEGRLYVQGTMGVRAVNPYNGMTLWECPIEAALKNLGGSSHCMGTSGTHGSLCMNGERLFVRTKDICILIDSTTGRRLGEYQAPANKDGKADVWGYIACDEGVLFGSLSNTQHIVKTLYSPADMAQQFTESSVLFALDAHSGNPLWTFRAQHSIRHNAIAVGGGRVYLIDRPRALMDLPDKLKQQGPQPMGTLIALDATSGKVLWSNTEDIFGTLLVLDKKSDALFMGYQMTEMPSDRGGQMVVFRGSDGRRLWSRQVQSTVRPILRNHTIYATISDRKGPGEICGMWDVTTGEEKTFDLGRQYGCGQISASANLMVYRSMTLSYFDFQRSKTTENFGGIRPGCWINAIPAAGLVLMPDATQGCVCGYQKKAWIALQGPDDNASQP